MVVKKSRLPFISVHGIGAIASVTLLLFLASSATAAPVQRSSAELRFATGTFRPERPSPVAPGWYRGGKAYDSLPLIKRLDALN